MSSSQVNTYSPSDVDLIVSGYKIFGWDSISIARNSPGFTPYKGIRGKDSRDRNTSTSATLSLSITSSCPVNTVLSYVHELDLEYGTGRLEITLKDGSGTSRFASSEAYILAYPPASFTGDTEYRLWTIYCQSTSSWTLGGNTKPTTPMFDKITDFASNIF